MNNLQQLYLDVPKMNILVRKILEQRMAFAQKIVASLIINKPQDRYTPTGICIRPWRTASRSTYWPPIWASRRFP